MASLSYKKRGQGWQVKFVVILILLAVVVSLILIGIKHLAERSGIS